MNIQDKLVLMGLVKSGDAWDNYDATMKEERRKHTPIDQQGTGVPHTPVFPRLEQIQQHTDARRPSRFNRWVGGIGSASQPASSSTQAMPRQRRIASPHTISENKHRLANEELQRMNRPAR